MADKPKTQGQIVLEILNENRAKDRRPKKRKVAELVRTDKKDSR